MDQEKRRSPGYFFFASAELTEEDSQVRVPSRLLQGWVLRFSSGGPDVNRKDGLGAPFAGCLLQG
jgi:hypothetical protein